MRTLSLLLLTLAACQGDGTPPEDTDSPVDDTDSPVDDTDETDAPPADSPVRINEVMASNAAAVERDDGEFPDWIELVNLTASAIDLGGATLTDDLGDPAKHVLPAGLILPANGYLILWADDLGERDDAAPFKLAADGESVGVYSPEGDAWDSLDYGPQTTDVSWARSPDGTGAFAPDATPTPGAANE
jgi:hypothetical protein